MTPSVRVLRTAALVVAAAAVGALIAFAVARNTSTEERPRPLATDTSTQAPQVTPAASGTSSGSVTSATSATSGTSGTTPSTTGSEGLVVTEQRTVPGFDGIVLASAATVLVHIAPSLPTAVTVTGEKAVLPRVLTRVVGGVLTISADRSYDTKSPLVVDVTTPSLTAAELRGSGEVTVDSLETSTFQAHLSGSGVVRLNGRVDNLRARIGGSGNIDAAGLRAHTVTAEIVGSGNIDVTASETLEARIPGSGQVRYGGSPRVNQTITGAGSVRQR